MSAWGFGHLLEHDHTGRYRRASGTPSQTLFRYRPASGSTRCFFAAGRSPSSASSSSTALQQEQAARGHRQEGRAGASAPPPHAGPPCTVRWSRYMLAATPGGRGVLRVASREEVSSSMLKTGCQSNRETTHRPIRETTRVRAITRPMDEAGSRRHLRPPEEGHVDPRGPSSRGTAGGPLQ